MARAGLATVKSQEEPAVKVHARILGQDRQRSRIITATSRPAEAAQRKLIKQLFDIGKGCPKSRT